MRNDTLKIMAWELMRNLRNKQYIISLLITPLIMVLFAGLPKLLDKMDKPSMMKLYIVDQAGIAPALQQMLPKQEYRIVVWHNRNEVEELVYKDKAAGYLIAEADFFSTGKLEYHYNKRNPSSFSIIRASISQLLKQQRMSTLQMTPTQLGYLTADAQISQIPMEKAAAPKDNAMAVSLTFLVLVFFLIFSSGSMLMQSALQERRDRMAEIVLSSIKPYHLMQGKILGHLLLGVIQLTFWIALSLPGVVYLLDFPLWQALSEVNVALLLFFGVGGYLLFSTIYVSIGSTMDDLQSAGNTQSMIMMIPMLSLLFITPVIRNPEGSISHFACIFPLTSPMAIIMRSAFSKIPLTEVLISAAVLLLSIFIFVRLAAKIFRVGMLMYGKTANFSEMIKWLKYKDR